MAFRVASQQGNTVWLEPDREGPHVGETVFIVRGSVAAFKVGELVEVVAATPAAAPTEAVEAPSTPVEPPAEN